MKPPLPLAEAQRRLLDLARALPSELVPADQAIGRYLAAPLLARRTQPPADLSAMDGYAIAGPPPWRMAGESKAGAPFVGVMSAGECIRISTGALMPHGADRVLLQEDAARAGDIVTPTGALPPLGRHIRRAGFDFSAGDHLMAQGTRIGPAQLALAISAGHSALELHRRPTVTIIDSGDELSANPDTCLTHQIPASNGAMLAAMAAEIPCDVHRIGPVPDRIEAVRAAFEACRGSDLIITSGGASVGDHDCIRPALEAWGAQIDFWRVAIKPGKPLLVARREGQIILGLPGNPVSSFVTSFLFMLPLIRHLSGAAHPLPVPVMRPTSVPLPAVGVRREFIRAIDDGDVVAPVDEQDSSALRALARANSLIERPEGSGEMKAGTYVPTYLLQNG